MFVAIDAVGIRGHGAAAVLCELLQWLPRVRPEWRWHVFMFERQLREFDDPPSVDSATIEQTNRGDGGLDRLWWVRKELQKRVKSIGADVLLSLANIGSPTPAGHQVVFVQQPNAFFDEGLPMFNVRRRARLRFMRYQILCGARASRAVIVQTEAMRERMTHFAPDLNGRIHIIPSGYRTTPSNPFIRPEKKAIIDNARRSRLIYVTHPAEHKNHTNLVQALPRILKVFPNASLLLTLEKDAAPDHRYRSFVQEIATLADSLLVSDHVVWLGILSADEVRYALSNSDLMVFPSLSESFGLGQVESMAAGCPVAASDLPYAHDVLGEAGVYFDPHDPKSIADVVISSLSNESLIASMKLTAAPMIERYSYENIAEQIAVLMGQVSGGNNHV